MANRLWLLAFVGYVFAVPTKAQVAPLSAVVVTSCGTVVGNSYTTGQNRPITMDTTGKLCLNNAGSTGTVTSISNSDGTIVLTPNPITTTGTVSLNLANANTWAAVQSFTNGDLSLLGSSSGNSLLEAPATGGGTATLFTGSDTIVGRATTDTLTNKSISGASNTITNIGNGALTNSSVTIGSTSVSLGGTAATIAGLTLTAPTFTTPSIGAATGTSLALNGCTIGTDNFCVTGTTTVGNVNVNGSTVPTLGVYANGSSLGFASAGVNRFNLNLANGFSSAISGGVKIGAGASSSTVPTLIPNNTAATTGFGGDGTNLYGIFTGVTGITWAPAGETISGATLGAASTVSPLVINTTWNDAGTTFKGALLVNVTNMASNVGSLLADFQVGSVSQANLTRTGTLGLLGSVNAGANLQAGPSSFVAWTGRGTLTSPALGIIQCGNIDSTTATACTFQAQSVAAGNGNTAGATFTIAGSKSNGSGGGDVIYQTTLSSAASGAQNTLATALTLKGGTQDAIFTGLITPSTAKTPTAGSGAASVAGNDQKFVVTAGTAQTSITVNFGHTWVSAPVCTISSNSTASVTDISSVSTTSITFGASVALTGATINAVCF